jgi:hypothetical protein
MFRNHKELVGFWKVRNLFEELSSVDNDVDCSLRQIVNFYFNIRHPKSFDKAFQDLDKTVGDTKTTYRTIKEIPVPVNIVQILLEVSAKPLAKAPSEVSVYEDPIPE